MDGTFAQSIQNPRTQYDEALTERVDRLSATTVEIGVGTTDTGLQAHTCRNRIADCTTSTAKHLSRFSFLLFPQIGKRRTRRPRDHPRKGQTCMARSALFCNIVCFVSDKSRRKHVNASGTYLRTDRSRTSSRAVIILCGQVHAPDLRQLTKKKKARHASKQQRTRNPADKPLNDDSPGSRAP